MTADQAIEEKNKGNAAYKEKNFAQAHIHYDKAIELDPTNITFYTNKAAVLFEEGRFDECIEMCKKAVDIGREHQADFKLIAKALGRISTSYLKQDNLKDGLVWLDKSLSEFRDPELVKKRVQVAKELAEKERLAYINPEIAQQEKEKGNEFFKKADYPNAMKHYNEAIKRDPDNAVLYSNRAACYTKLAEFSLAVTDCDTCIKKDPKFIKGYTRKGAALQGMRDFGKAQRAYEDALSIDPNNQEARDGLMQCMRNNDEDPEKARERALQDPEVQAILKDPGMRMILEQMSNDPGAIKEHLKNPDILAKLMKLRDAGIVQMR